MHEGEGPSPQTGSVVHAPPSDRAAPIGAKRRIVEVDGHAQARSRRTLRCFLTCQASAHRCGERGGMRVSRGHAVYDKRGPPEDLLQLPSLLSKQVSLTCIVTGHRSGWAALAGVSKCVGCSNFNTRWGTCSLIHHAHAGAQHTGGNGSPVR